MKLKVFLFCSFVCICVCFCFCISHLTVKPQKNTNTDIDTSTENISEHTKPTDETSNIFDTCGLFHAKTESQVSFYLLIKDNPIDLDYRSEENDGTTLGMRKIEQLYTNIWLDELEYSCQSFSELLNDEDRKKFESIQANWEKNLAEDTRFINTVFGKEEYNVFLGTMFFLESDIEYREMIRQRTMYIKYFQYCMESSNITLSDTGVKFRYQSKDSAGENWAYKSNCKLIVNNKDIGDNYYLRINSQIENAELPIIPILHELGANIQSNETGYIIEFNGKTLHLDSHSKDFGLPILSENTNAVRKIFGGELIVDSNSISKLLTEFMGAEIRLDYDSYIIYIDTITNQN